MIETLILSHLTHNEHFFGQVVNHLEPALFQDHIHRKLLGCMKDYFEKYGKMATMEAVKIAFGEAKGINDEQYIKGLDVLANLKPDTNTSLQYLIDETETWVKNRKLHNALWAGIEIEEGTRSGVASDLLKEAEGFSFKARDLTDHFMTFGKRQKKKNPVIAGIMSPEDASLFVGQPGSFKSFIALYMFYCTSTGRDFEGHGCQQGAGVLFVGEGDAGIEDRVIALESQYGFRWSDIPCEIISLSNPSNRCPIYDPDSKNGNKERFEWIKDHVTAVSLKHGRNVNHIGFDTFRTAVNGIDENAAKHVTPAMLHFKAIARDQGAAVSVFHHTNRELKDFSGSGSFKSDCDNLYFIELFENEPLTAMLTVAGHKGKQKDFGKLDDILFKMVPHVTGEYENGAVVTSLAATIGDVTTISVKEAEDVVLALVKEYYSQLFNDEPLLKSDLTKMYKQRLKAKGDKRSDDAFYKEFREKHFKPLLNAGLIDYMPTTYVGNAKEDGIVTLRVAPPLAEAA